MMNKKISDNEIFEMLADSFREEAKKTELPESLSKDNIVAMLKQSQNSQNGSSGSNIVDFNEALAQEKNEVQRLRKLNVRFKTIISIAAALVVFFGMTVASLANNKAPEKRNPIEKVIVSASSGIAKGVKTVFGVDDSDDDEINKDIGKEISSAVVQEKEDKTRAVIPEKTTTVVYTETLPVADKEPQTKKPVEKAKNYMKSVSEITGYGEYVFRLGKATDPVSQKECFALDTVRAGTGEQSEAEIIDLFGIIDSKLEAGASYCKRFVYNYDSHTLITVFTNDRYTFMIYFDVDTDSATKYIVKSTAVLNGTYAYSEYKNGKLAVAVYTEGTVNNYSLDGGKTFLSVSRSEGAYHVDSSTADFTFVSISDIGNLSANNAGSVISVGVIGGHCGNFTFNGERLFVSDYYGDEGYIYSYYTTSSRYIGESMPVNRSFKGSIIGSIYSSDKTRVRFMTVSSDGYREYSVDFSKQQPECTGALISADGVLEGNKVVFNKEATYLFTNSACYLINRDSITKPADGEGSEAIKTPQKIDGLGGANAFYYIGVLNEKVVAVPKAQNESGKIVFRMIDERGEVRNMAITGTGSLRINPSKEIYSDGTAFVIPLVSETSSLSCIVDVSGVDFTLDTGLICYVASGSYTAYTGSGYYNENGKEASQVL
jgi:hypothetical protein